jgi:uncharacterized protein (TIGR03437 family)
VTVTVRVAGEATVINNVPVLPHQPGIFETTDANGLRYAVLLHEDGSYVTPQSPARPGEILRLFATGLGQTSPATGTNRAGVPLQSVLATLVVGVNNEGVRVVSAEYMVGAVGIYVIAFQVPAPTAGGPNQPLALAVVGPDGNLIFGNASNFAIQQ